jgi:uncharacterized protein
MRLIGVISDTHGLLRDEAVKALRGTDLIIHAGDVGGPDILDALAEIAPVRVVRGNTDYGAFGQSLPLTEVVELADRADEPLAYVLHDLDDLDLEPTAADFAVVIFGHSHRPLNEERAGVLYFNPGAAGHRRFTLPATVGRLRIDAAGRVSGEIIELTEDA